MGWWSVGAGDPWYAHVADAQVADETCRDGRLQFSVPGLGYCPAIRFIGWIDRDDCWNWRALPEVKRMYYRALAVQGLDSTT